MGYKKKSNEVIIKKLLDIKLVTDNGCWILARSRNGDYATIGFNGETWSIHRLSLFLFKPEEYREGLDVLHSCDTPACFNPDHLSSGTKSKNQFDSVEHGRHANHRKTSCPKGHEYSEENTYLNPSGRRQCKICNNQRRMYQNA